jgi:drug/metabolite transporter (DMT)-like permease
VERLALIAALAAIGAAWGLSLPLLRIAVSTGHGPFGLMVWQSVIMLAALCAMLRAVGRGPAPVRGNLGLFAAASGFGAVIPGFFTFLTAGHLPAGVRAIIIAMVPMFVLPMALAMGFERPYLRRTLGVLLGAVAVVLLVLPGADATEGAGVVMLLLALLAPASYGLEASYLAWRGPHALHPFQLLLGATALGLVVLVPIASATGQFIAPWPLGRSEAALVGAALLNVLAYSGYVWLIGRAGSVFASLISYLVTGFGVLFSRLVLGETYSVLVWASLALMVAAIALVQPLGAAAKNA